MTKLNDIDIYIDFFLSFFFSFRQDILYICNRCGPVQRIVIFGKNRVQAMVEYPFESILSLQPQWQNTGNLAGI